MKVIINREEFSFFIGSIQCSCCNRMFDHRHSMRFLRTGQTTSLLSCSTDRRVIDPLSLDFDYCLVDKSSININLTVFLFLCEISDYDHQICPTSMDELQT